MKPIGIQEEIEERYTDAIQVYEKEISSGKTVSEYVYLNLAFLWWIFASDYSFATYYGISQSLRDKGAVEYKRVLQKASIIYPNSLEIKFWVKYFPHREYFEEFTKEQCLNLIETNGQSPSLVPYFFLHLFEEENYDDQISALLEKCNETPTAKHRYIKSLLS